MPSLTEWRVPPAFQPRPGDYSFVLDRALSSVVGLHSLIPADAFTADTLGTERAGNGVVIDDGLVLTIGYLITEAETVWLHLGEGRTMEGHVLGFDAVSGFGLVQALGHLDIEPLPLDHPFRKIDRLLATPHIGYVSRGLYERFYRDMAANIATWLESQH